MLLLEDGKPELLNEMKGFFLSLFLSRNKYAESPRRNCVGSLRSSQTQGLASLQCKDLPGLNLLKAVPVSIAKGVSLTKE